MLNAIYLIAIISGVSGQNVSKKSFTQLAGYLCGVLSVVLLNL